MKFFKLFLICMFNNPKLAEIFTNLAEKEEKKLNSTEFMEFGVSKSVVSQVSLGRGLMEGCGVHE